MSLHPFLVVSIALIVSSDGSIIVLFRRFNVRFLPLVPLLLLLCCYTMVALSLSTESVCTGACCCCCCRLGSNA